MNRRRENSETMCIKARGAEAWNATSARRDEGESARLNELIRRHVDRRSRFVKNEDFGTAKKSASHAHELALTHGQIRSLGIDWLEKSYT